VFWVAGPGREEEVRGLLDRHARQIRWLQAGAISVARQGIIQRAGMGQVPKLTFVRDQQYELESHMTQLFRWIVGLSLFVTTLAAGWTWGLRRRSRPRPRTTPCGGSWR